MFDLNIKPREVEVKYILQMIKLIHPRYSMRSVSDEIWALTATI
jgi:hypothetical protein